MKILQVIPYFDWSYGGPVRVVYDISQQLSKKGHNVTIYTTDAGMNHRTKEDKQIKLNDDVKIEYFKCVNNWLANNIKLHISYQMFVAIQTEIKNYDIIHLHECRGVPHIYVWYFAQKYNIPYIVEAHGATPKRIGNQNSIQTMFKICYDEVVGKKILKNASKLVALTDTEAKEYIKFGIDPSKIQIIPNGIDLQKYNLQNKKYCKAESNLDEEQKIVYVGRLHESKGIDLLVKAFSILSHEIKNVKLILVGPDDGYQSYLKGLSKSLNIESQIVFTGFVSVDEKMEILSEADVFVTPQYSGFPITFLEACLCGTPIITTSKGDKLDWINNKVGYVIDEYDANKLKDAILKILSNKELKERFGREGQRLVTEKFDLSKIVIELEEVYLDDVFK